MHKFIEHLLSKNKPVLPFAIFAYILAILVLFLVIFIRFMYKIPMAELTRDPVQLLHGRPYTGNAVQPGYHHLERHCRDLPVRRDFEPALPGT